MALTPFQPRKRKISNCSWPMIWGSGGLTRVTGWKREEQALQHLAGTKRGELLADPKYGATFHLVLTQGVIVDADGGGSIPGFAAAASELVGSISTYVPSVEMLGARVVPTPGDLGETGDVEIGWRSAETEDSDEPENLGKGRVTQVTI